MTKIFIPPCKSAEYDDCGIPNYENFKNKIFNYYTANEIFDNHDDIVLKHSFGDIYIENPDGIKRNHDKELRTWAIQPDMYKLLDENTYKILIDIGVEEYK